MSDPLDLALIYQGHHIEKKWHIHDRIHHRDDLTSDCVWHEIAESDRCCRDHREVKCVKITLSDRVSSLKIMYCKGPHKPTHEEPCGDSDDLLMMDMARHILTDNIPSSI